MRSSQDNGVRNLFALIQGIRMLRPAGRRTSRTTSRTPMPRMSRSVGEDDAYSDDGEFGDAGEECPAEDEEKQNKAEGQNEKGNEGKSEVENEGEGRNDGKNEDAEKADPNESPRTTPRSRKIKRKKWEPLQIQISPKDGSQRCRKLQVPALRAPRQHPQGSPSSQGHRGELRRACK